MGSDKTLDIKKAIAPHHIREEIWLEELALFSVLELSDSYFEN